MKVKYKNSKNQNFTQTLILFDLTSLDSEDLLILKFLIWFNI